MSVAQGNVDAVSIHTKTIQTYVRWCTSRPQWCRARPRRCSSRRRSVDPGNCAIRQNIGSVVGHIVGITVGTVAMLYSRMWLLTCRRRVTPRIENADAACAKAYTTVFCLTMSWTCDIPTTQCIPQRRHTRFNTLREHFQRLRGRLRSSFRSRIQIKHTHNIGSDPGFCSTYT